MSSNEIAKTNTAIAEHNEFTNEQVSLIKRTVAKGSTDDELKLFVHIADRTGLDPFARQIYAIKRNGQMTFQTGIDGYRLCADRTGKYAGNDPAVFEYVNEKLKSCTFVLYKMVQGQKVQFSAKANWEEYYPGEKLGYMWNKMPETMLEKCAEAKALRRAFPQELSGIYTNDEMQQADNTNNDYLPTSPPTQKKQPKKLNIKNVSYEYLADKDKKELTLLLKKIAKQYYNITSPEKWKTFTEEFLPAKFEDWGEQEIKDFIIDLVEGIN